MRYWRSNEISTSWPVSTHLKNAGFLHCSVRHLGGLRVLIKCALLEELTKLTAGENNWFADWFNVLSPWSLEREKEQQGRMVWLHVSGVPLHA